MDFAKRKKIVNGLMADHDIYQEHRSAYLRYLDGKLVKKLKKEEIDQLKEVEFLNIPDRDKALCYLEGLNDTELNDVRGAVERLKLYTSAWTNLRERKNSGSYKSKAKGQGKSAYGIDPSYQFNGRVRANRGSYFTPENRHN